MLNNRLGNMSAAAAAAAAVAAGTYGVMKRKKVSRACACCRRSHMTCNESRPCARCVRRGVSHLCVDEPKKPRKKRVSSGKKNNTGKTKPSKKQQVSWDPATLGRTDSSVHLGPTPDSFLAQQSSSLVNSPSHSQGLFTPMLSNTIMTVNGLQEIEKDTSFDASSFPETLFSSVVEPNHEISTLLTDITPTSGNPETITDNSQWLTPHLGGNSDRDQELIMPLLGDSSNELLGQTVLPTPPLTNADKMVASFTANNAAFLQSSGVPEEIDDETMSSVFSTGASLHDPAVNGVLLADEKDGQMDPSYPFMTPANRSTTLISQSLDLNSLFSDSPKEILPSLFTTNEEDSVLSTVADTNSIEFDETLARDTAELTNTTNIAPFNLYQSIQNLHVSIVNSAALVPDQKQELLTAIQVVLSSIPIPLHLLSLKDASNMERKVARLLTDYRAVFDAYDCKADDSTEPDVSNGAGALTENEALLSIFGDKTPSNMLPTCIWRTTGQILLHNRQFSELLNFQNGKPLVLENANIEDILHPSSLVSLWKEFAFLVASQEQRARVDPCLVRNLGYPIKNEEWLNTVASFMVWQTNDGVPLVVVGTFFPISI